MNLKKILLVSSMFLSTALITTNQSYASTAPTVNPVDWLNSVIVDTQNIINKNKEKYANKKEILKLVNTNIMPYIDSKIMAHIIVGDCKWNGGTIAINGSSCIKNNNNAIYQQNAFIHDLKNMIVNTYQANIAKTSSAYTISFNPFTGNGWKDKRVVLVNGVIKKNSDQNIRIGITVKLLKNTKNESKSPWLIYNIVISGVDVLKTLQEQLNGLGSSLASINKSIERRYASNTTDK